MRTPKAEQTGKKGTDIKVVPFFILLNDTP